MDSAFSLQAYNQRLLTHDQTPEHVPKAVVAVFCQRVTGMPKILFLWK